MHHINPDRCAPECDDQLPMISRVGRGIHGDTYKVDIQSDSNCETILEGSAYDYATKEWTSEWLSENINGGCLSYQYKLRPGTVPATFTITFIYRRPGRPEWTWTTPAIPYIWTVDEDGNKNPGDPDTMVGSGIATLFIKKTTESNWTEKLVYPSGTTREDFNAPDPLEAWTSNIEFGIGGDIDVPNIDDLAKVLGITVGQIEQIIAGNTVTINGVSAANLRDYIDKQDDLHQQAAVTSAVNQAKAYTDSEIDGLSDHIHSDMGFNTKDHSGNTAFGGYANIKAYIDARDSAVSGEVSDLENQLNALKTYVSNALSDILSKIYGGGSLGSDGNITWPNTNKIPVADLNVFANSTPTNSTYTDAIRSRDLADDDVRVI